MSGIAEGQAGDGPNQGRNSITIERGSQKRSGGSILLITMTDKMDVDVSGLEPTSASSSFEKLDTAKLDLDALNKSMKNNCNDQV